MPRSVSLIKGPCSSTRTYGGRGGWGGSSLRLKERSRGNGGRNRMNKTKGNDADSLSYLRTRIKEKAERRRGWRRWGRGRRRW